jgi:copper transport protein
VRALVALAAVVVAALTPAVASAHAVLLRATPSSSQTLAQAPEQVQLLFSEPLDPVFSHVQVQDATGQVVDLGDSHVDPNDDRLLVASLPPGLPNGVYSVNWRSLSAIDVHPDEGQLPLFVGVPVTRQAAVSSTYANTATPATTFARWWFYVAASLFGGVLATWKLVVVPLLDEGDTYRRAPLHGRAFSLIVAGGVLLLLGTLFSAVAQAASAANVPLGQAFGQPLADLLLRGRFASIWWPRLGLEVAGLALIVFGGIDGLAAECALATLPAVLLTSALTSHGAALPGGAAPGIAIDWLHIVGATAWVGGLMALAALLPLLRTDSTSPPLGPRILARFARLALASALVVLLSGVLQSALEVGSWAALVSTTYGQLVLVKVAFLLAMLGLAAYNEWRARRAPSVGLQRGVGIELALGVVVFGVAAVLSGTPPSLTG